MTQDASVRTYREISATELENHAHELADAGRRWHFHIATAGCAIAEDRSGIILVLEDSDTNVLCRAAATQDDVATIGIRLARRLHGSDVVDEDVSEPTGGESSSEMEVLIAAARRLSEEAEPWHHHMLFPDCAFNPNPGLWTLQLEAGESAHIATSSSEPRAALSVLEKLFYAQTSHHLITQTTASPAEFNDSVGPVLPEGTGEPDTPVHHQVPTSAFTQFMSQGWAPPSGALPARDAIAAYTRERRSRLSALFPGQTLVVPTGGLKVRVNDTDYPFRPGSDFFWLTGYHEPDAVLVLFPSSGTHDAVLFMAPRSDRSTSGFYRDGRYGELWVGPRPGLEETAAALDIECRDIGQLPEAVSALDVASTRALSQIEGLEADADLATVLSELRLIKDDYEIAMLDQAIAATVTGFEECVREFAYASQLENGERWIEGTFFRRSRTDGNDVGYGSIVACGHHATTLHWMRNDGQVLPTDMALLDMGVESRSLYTADVTRTLPIGGKYNEVQRRVYEVVFRAHQAGLEAVRPGAAFLDPHRAAMRVIAEALDSWGLLSVSVDEALSEDGASPGAGLYRRYTLHSTSHMLGLDVHDCAEARRDFYQGGALEPGMVLTVEPGLYFQLDDETVPEELRGIGVRIEDDVVVTHDGHRNMSDALPSDPDEIEAWMALLRGAPPGG